MEKMTRPTLLTRKDLSVTEILNEKLKATSPEQAVDYVEYTDTLIQSELEQIKQAKKELSMLESNLKSEQERIKIGTAHWLDSLGVDKLDGLRVSSITKYTPKPTVKLNILDEEFFISMGMKIETVKVDETRAKEWINKHADERGLDTILEVFKDKFTREIVHKEDVAKINRRKV